MATERSGGRIDGLGALRGSTDRRPTNPPTGHARLLLEALVTAPDHRLPAAHAVQALWPGVGDRVGRQRLQTTASRLRRGLPIGMQLTFTQGAYHLTAETDLDDFRRLADVRWPRLSDALPPVGRVRLVVLAAPSGFGKTTLLRHWSASGRVAWVDASRALDGDANLRGAIDVALRSAGVVATQADDEAPSVNQLANAMLAEASPTALVIDDLENLHNGAAHRVVHDIIRLAPDHVTVAIASRRRIPATLNRFAASADAVLLSADQLAFTAEEAQLAVEHLAGPDTLAGFPVRALHRVTGGWPAPMVRIASELLDPRRPQILPEPGPDAIEPDPDARLLGALADDFQDGILEGLAPEDRAWLVATAHLDDLHDELCASVTERPTRPVVTRLVVDHHLLARTGTLLRPRPPLQHLLRRRQMRDSAAAKELHRRSAQWHLVHGRADHALDQSLRSGDSALRQHAVEPALRHAIDAGNVDALRRWAPLLVTDLAAAGDELTLLAAVLWPRAIRNRLAAGVDALRSETSSAAIEAVELWSIGRCADALAAARQVRRLPAADDSPAATATTAVLMSIEIGCRILLGHDLDGSDVSSLLRAADRAHQPWIRLWVYGQLALHAHVTDDRGKAGALLAHARRLESQVHGSARFSVGGFALATQTLTQATSEPASATSDEVVALRRLAQGARRAGWKPVESIAKYGLHELLRRGGHDEDAATALSAADHGTLQLPELAFLDTVRTRAVGGAAGVALDAAGLTDRERTVLRYLETDLTLRQIADALFVSLHTVRAHTRSIYRKVGVTRRADAVALRTTVDRAVVLGTAVVGGSAVRPPFGP